MKKKKPIRRLINTFGKSELMAPLKGHRRDDDAEDDDDYSWSVEFKYWFWLGRALLPGKGARGSPGLGYYPDYPWPQFKC